MFGRINKIHNNNNKKKKKKKKEKMWGNNLVSFTSLQVFYSLNPFTKATWGTLVIQYDTRLIVQTTHIRCIQHSN